MFRSGLAFGGVRVRCLCVRCVLCLVCLPLRVRPRVCPVPVLRFWADLQTDILHVHVHMYMDMYLRGAQGACCQVLSVWWYVFL